MKINGIYASDALINTCAAKSIQSNDPRERPVCFAIVVNQYWVSAGDIRDQVEAMMVEIAEMAYKF